MFFQLRMFVFYRPIFFYDFTQPDCIVLLKFDVLKLNQYLCLAYFYSGLQNTRMWQVVKNSLGFKFFILSDKVLVFFENCYFSAVKKSILTK